MILSKHYINDEVIIILVQIQFDLKFWIRLFILKFSFSKKARKIWCKVLTLLSNVKTLRTIVPNLCGLLIKVLTKDKPHFYP
jgi:hypothetical protein